MREAKLQQEIEVVGDDRVGVVADVSRLLGDMGINLLSVSVYTESDRARIRLVTTSQTYAREALLDAGFAIEERDVVVVEMPHHPGFLSRITEALARKGIAIFDLHASVSEDAHTGVVVFTCSNNLHAAQLLRGR